MPVIKTIKTNNEEVFVWQIMESLQELEKEFSDKVPEDDKLPKIKFDSRKVEYLASRILLFDVLKSHQIDFKCVQKNEHGKPFLRNSKCSFSISHTKGYVAVIFSSFPNCGIDIETKFSQAFKLRNKFCSKHELSICENSLIAVNLWSAKEALYKADGNRKLIFDKDLLLHQPNFNINLVNSFLLKQRNTVLIQNFSTDDFVLNYCVIG